MRREIDHTCLVTTSINVHNSQEYWSVKCANTQLTMFLSFPYIYISLMHFKRIFALYSWQKLRAHSLIYDRTPYSFFWVRQKWRVGKIMIGTKKSEGRECLRVGRREREVHRALGLNALFQFICMTIKGHQKKTE